jgi:hypothetical protein
MLGDRSGYSADTPAIVAVPFHLLAVFASVKAAVRVQSALTQLKPPEILHRLTEAMKYLQP